MKVGIDARMYGPSLGGGGIGRYVQELVTNLEALPTFPPCTLFVKPEAATQVVTRPNVKVNVVDIHWYTLREQLMLPRVMDAERLDLIHVPHWNVPIGLKTPFVVTIHDLILLEEPRSARVTTRHPLTFALKQWGFRKVLRHAVMASKKIIAVSQATKESILKHFPEVPADKIVVIYEGVTALPAPDDSVSIEKPYVLAVGNAYPHKNLKSLLEAFRLVAAKHPSTRLVIAGRDDVFSKRLLKSKEAAALGDVLEFVANPTDAQLASLYQNALCYVFPSRIEGFGLPPLEAMSQGLPVASSNAGSLAEVLGDAALFFDPLNVRNMATSIIKLIDEPKLRSELIARGEEQVKKYSWKKMAEETLSVYHAVDLP